MGSTKSWTRAGSGEPAGRYSRPPFTGHGYSGSVTVARDAAVLAVASDAECDVTARLLPPRFCFDASDEQLVVNKAVEEVVPFLG
ncbi:hypothetical protein GFL54_29415 [Rhizobium laguerreae]|nr:hypothetical protein [Rhizobium laguerreae]NKN09978.1 hypothetical protein [Rhizobium laguerreae]